MHMTLNNFLMAIKNIVMGGGRATDGSPRNDSGYLVDNHDLIGSSTTPLTTIVNLTDSSGGTANDTVQAIGGAFNQAEIANNFADVTAKINAILNFLKGTAAVSYIADSDGFPVLNAAANTTAVATVGFLVPRDYDEATDILRLKLCAKMGGATDTPTLTVTAKKKTTLTTAAAAITPVSGSPTAALSATAQNFELEFRGQGLIRNSFVEITITSGAHTTDALQLQVLGTAYRSCLVSYRETDGTRDGKDGNSLR